MSDRRYNKNNNYRNYKGGSKKGNYRRSGNRKGKSSKRRTFNLPRGTVIYILDILELGHQRNNQLSRSNPLVQVIECPNFNLFEMSYDNKQVLKLQEKITISNNETRVGKVLKRIKYHGLTPTAKELIQNTIEKHVIDEEQRYITFINKAGPINKRRHTLNLLPGVGEKLMWEIVNSRDKKPFESFEDFHSRIKSIKSLPQLISKRILNELIDDEEKHVIFVKRRPQNPQGQRSNQPGERGSHKGDRRRYQQKRDGYQSNQPRRY